MLNDKNCDSCYELFLVIYAQPPAYHMEAIGANFPELRDVVVNHNHLNGVILFD